MLTPLTSTPCVRWTVNHKVLGCVNKQRQAWFFGVNSMLYDIRSGYIEERWFDEELSGCRLVDGRLDSLSLPFIPSCLPTTARLSGTDIILSQWIL